MKYQIALTNRAARDLERLTARVLYQAPTQGADWLDGFEDAIASLNEFPERCGTDPESPGTNGEIIRQLLYGTRPNVYRVLFYIDAKSHTVVVLTIRHGRQKTAKRR